MFVIRVFYKIALRSHKGMAFTDVAIKYDKFNYIPYTPKETVE